MCMAWTLTGAFTRRCRGCDMAYYCSEACERTHVERRHAVICPLVRRLMAHKANEHTKSLMLLSLVVLLERHLEAAGVPMCAQGSSGAATGEPSADPPPRPADAVATLVPAYADVEALQSHVGDWTADDLVDWRYALVLRPCACIHTHARRRPAH